MSFSFSQQIRGDVVLLEVRGYLNLDGGRELGGRLLSLLEKKHTRIVVDFREAPLISSQALGQILDVITQIIPRPEVAIAFSSLSEVARMSMRILGILEYIPDYSSSDEACLGMAPVG
jgi:anti-anti-sigma regulatory factor